MYLMKVAQDLPECGFLIQVYAKGLMGKNALSYASDIMDRLFGKARQVNELSVPDGVALHIDKDTADALDKWTRKEDD